MRHSTGGTPKRPRSTALRWELAAASVLKLVLLTGLWFLIYRWDGQQPAPRPDVADRFFRSDPAAIAAGKSPAPIGP